MINRKEQIIKNIREASLEEILDRRDVDRIDWFWINKDIFPDILRNISSIPYYEQEEEMENFLKEVKEEEFLSFVKPEMERRGFIGVSQEVYGKLDPEYSIIPDIQTWIFLKESYYHKLWIAMYRKLEWILRAMSVDAYQRLDVKYNTLEETYEELFENNNRIIEEIVENNTYVLESGKWILNKAGSVLTFYKKGKIFHRWSQGEVESRFMELQL